MMTMPIATIKMPTRMATPTTVKRATAGQGDSHGRQRHGSGVIGYIVLTMGGREGPVVHTFNITQS